MKTTACDVVIVVPPFAHAGFPSLGPSLLKAQCRAAGVATSVLYSNLILAARIGFAPYNRIATAFDDALVGEQIFRAAAFPEAHQANSETLVGELPDISKHPESPEELAEMFFSTNGPVDKTAVNACVSEVEPFLAEVERSILDSGVRIVGFSSIHLQTLASIALASRLKAVCPELITVLGGGNASVPMGEALSAVTDVFDYVFSGEADVAFPQFCKCYLDNGMLPLTRIVHCPPVRTLDQTAAPDYDDYRDQVAALTRRSLLPSGLPFYLFFETSRGCRWRERSHCLFCGLNGSDDTAAFRQKSPARVVQELAHLSARYGTRRLRAVDRSFPKSYRRRLLPALEAANGGYELFWEIRPDATEEELDLFIKIGLTVLQPGIESCSTRLLRQLGKGTTGIGNLVFLRECASRGVRVHWNLLVGIPNETTADYEAIIRLFPLIEHLQPPLACGSLRVDRFSPLYRQAHRLGLTNLRPFPGYSRLFPGNAAELAQHFVADMNTVLSGNRDLQLRLAGALLRWMGAWRGNDEPPILGALPLTAGLTVIRDTRSCATETFTIVPREQYTNLLTFNQPIRKAKVSSNQWGALDELLRKGWVVEHEEHYLSVVTLPLIGQRLHAERQRRAAAKNAAPDRVVSNGRGSRTVDFL